MFKARMNSLMLDALALEPIATSREMPSQNRTVLYSDGWTAYTGAFLFDSDSSALIGEHVGSDFTQRLLQVFLGIPWATTLFQARAAKRVAESQVQSRRRAIGKLGDQSVEDLQARLAETRRKIADGTARDQALAKLASAKAKFSELSLKVSGLQTAIFVLSSEISAGEDGLIQKKRVLLACEEELAASKFLGRLNPTCCPRCTQTFTENRLNQERLSGDCSVCLSPVQAESAVDYEALKETTKKDIKKSEKLLSAVKSKSVEFAAELVKTRADLDATAEEVAKLSGRGTALEEQTLCLEAARIEGILEAVTKLVGSDTGEEAAVAVLAAATDEAKRMVEASAEAILERSSELICGLLTRLGMKDVERVVLKRNASIEIHKGGGKSTFTKLSAGERLRVRIATIISLLQASEQSGVGRHPGLLIIDSPAKEEMADANVEEMLGALSELSKDVNVQLFVAFRGTKRALEHFEEERCLLAKAGTTLW